MTDTTLREATTSGESDSLLPAHIAAAPISWGVCEVPDWGMQLPPERVLSEMASLGLRATEAGPIGYLGRHPESLRATLDRHGLELVGGFVPLVLHDRRTQADAVAAARELAAAFAAAGASVLITAVVLDLDWSPPVLLSDAQWRAIWDGLARIDDVAAEQKVAHVVHPHWGTLISGRDDVARLVEESTARICLDTGHLFLGGTDAVWLAEAAGERIGHVHLKDVAAGTAERLREGELTFVDAVQADLFRPLGSGDAPVAETIRVLASAGYDGWYVLEQDRAFRAAGAEDAENVRADVKRSIGFVQSILRKANRNDPGNGKEGT